MSLKPPSERLLSMALLAAALTAAVSGVAGLPGAALAQEPGKPLPDTSAYLRSVRERLDSVWPPPLDASYCVGWVDRGGPGKPRRWVYEVRPAPAHLDLPPYWRLLFDGDTVVSEARLAREDRQNARRIAEEDQRRKAESASARAQRVSADIDDLFRNYDTRIEQRVRINGRSAMILSLTPRERASLRGRYGSILRHARARAWIDEQEHELIRAEGELFEDALIALGVVARAHRGTRGVFVRSRLENGRWAPVEARVTGSVRRLLVDVKQIDMHIQFFGYAFGRETPAADCLAAGTA